VQTSARGNTSLASAVRNLRTGRGFCSDYLFPFALWMVFPSSLVGRYAHDYYGNSVTLRVAPFRSSRVPSPSNVIERRRLPTHPLECVHYASLLGQSVTGTKLEFLSTEDIGVQTCYRRMCGSTAGD
jgi:hypothetical protein